ncbi:MAG: MOSC N-terminal beta barrel domain-containing protein [Burkholderiaceae bacterium]|nr:MAG: MOSC N-terminal beta barrel domain-containing protein [Burkholderiaceae bacterium]
MEGLFVHPVKSCAGVAVREALLTEAGLDLDRAWMLVDEAGEFVTQRELPQLARVVPRLGVTDVVLRAPGMLALHLAADAVEAPARVRIWDDEVDAWDMGDLAAQWFSDFTGQRLRLVRFDPEVRRLSSRRWTGGVEAPNLFSDGFPLLVTSSASLVGLNERLAAAGHAPVDLRRFRPNLVLGGVEPHDEDRLAELRIRTDTGTVRLALVKPCARCPIPDVGPTAARAAPAVGDTLRGYRADARLGGALTFGMNAIVLEGAGQVLRVGQPVAADWAFG